MHEWWFAIWILLAAGFCGAGALAAFLPDAPFVVLASPFAGLLLVPFGANAIYPILNCTYATAAGLSAAILAAWTLFNIRSIARAKPLYAIAILIPLATAITVPLMDAASIRLGAPAILFLDGMDQADYAQMADWLNHHLISQTPDPSPQRPYESWPDASYRSDPRFGSFGLLATISRLHATPAIFSFDIACAILIAAASLAVAAVYADSGLWFLILCLALFSTKLVDEAQLGYFGKIIDYPGVLLVIGLVFRAIQSYSSARVFSIVLLAAAVGIAHSGLATSILIAPVFLIVLALTARWDRATLSQSWLVCALAVFIPVLASGLFSRMYNLKFYYAPTVPRWWLSIPRDWDLESHGWVSGLTQASLALFTLASFAAAAILTTLSVRQRAAKSAALFTGPLIVLAVFYCRHDRAAGSELVAWIYPASLCGMCLLAPRLPAPRYRLLLLILTISVAMRLPRLMGVIHRYAGNPDPRSAFTLPEMDRIAQEAGNLPVLIDVHDGIAALFLLEETGRRGMNVQWTPQSWIITVGYRHWTQPLPAAPPALILSRNSHPTIGKAFELSRH